MEQNVFPEKGSDVLKKQMPFATLRGSIACYFAIALLPLLLILGYAYGKSIQNEQRESINRLSMTLQASVQSLDTSIDAAEKACITLFYDNRVKRHLKPVSESTVEDRMAQVEIHSTITSLVSITDAVTETMLMYLDDKHVFSEGLYSFYDYFTTLNAFEDYDLDFWKSLLNKHLSMEILPATQMDQKRVNTSQRVIPIVYNTRVSGRPVVMVITLSVENMVSTIKNNLEVQGIRLALLDQEGREIFADPGMADINTLQTSSLQIDQTHYQIISCISEQNGFHYFLAVPYDIIYAMNDNYLLFAAAALIMGLGTGILIIFFSHKISQPIQHICSALDSQSEGEPKSIHEVSSKFGYFLSTYLETQEEARSMRANFIEMSVLRLLSGHIRHIPELTRLLEQECSFTDPIFQLCVIDVAFSSRQNEIQDTERINIQLNFRNDLSAYLSRSLLCMILEERPNQYICLVNRSEDDDALYEVMEQLLKQVQDGFAVERMHICVSEGGELNSLSGAYEQTMRVLASMSSGPAYAIRKSSEEGECCAIAFTLKDEMQLLSALRGSDPEKVYALMHQMLSSGQKTGAEQEKLRIHDLFVTGMRYLAERDETLLDQNQYQGLRADVDLPGGIEVKRRLLDRFYHELTEIRSIGTESNLTASIVSYVQQHYASDLYLEQIAQGLGLSVKYISKVFKEKTGRNLSDYINEVRISHVKDMLENTNMSIANISESAGIYSQSTLIRLFRKYEGVTPSEYREFVRSQTE